MFAQLRYSDKHKRTSVVCVYTYMILYNQEYIKSFEYRYAQKASSVKYFAVDMPPKASKPTVKGPAATGAKKPAAGAKKSTGKSSTSKPAAKEEPKKERKQIDWHLSALM